MHRIQYPYTDINIQINFKLKNNMRSKNNATQANLHFIKEVSVWGSAMIPASCWHSTKNVKYTSK